MVTRAIKKAIVKAMKKSNMDQTLASFESSFSYVALVTIVVIIAALRNFVVRTAPFVAIIGAAGLAGALMIIFKPFKVGDYIQREGAAGTVE
jgi:small conductance mechanosensitive channel